MTEPKFKLQDKVWLMNNNTPTVEIVVAIVLLHDKVLYGTQYMPQEERGHKGLTWGWLRKLKEKYGKPELGISNLLSGVESFRLKDGSSFYSSKQELLDSL